ncbi:hypothetical protein [Flavobacterium cyclinae]|jgi:hypothetical protein|nr:hypothetical protein [Flavobacterium cyclinae]
MKKQIITAALLLTVLDRKVSDDMRILKEKYLGKNVQLNHKTN